VERPFEAHSVRKSLVSGLYGVAVARGEIDLDASLATFAIDDQTPLTATERSATIRQVISAMSGVYLPAAYAPASQDRRPERGTHSPGTHWFYNNWDFNVAGVIYERPRAKICTSRSSAGLRSRWAWRTGTRQTAFAFMSRRNPAIQPIPSASRHHRGGGAAGLT
jgi:hypothetical protein